MAGGMGWSKKGIGKSLRSSSRASTPPRFLSRWKIHCAGFSEKRPWRVLPTITEMSVMVRSLLAEEIQSRAERGVPADATPTPSQLPDGTETPPRTRLVIAPRPVQEGTSLVPKHIKVAIESRRQRDRMGTM